MEGAWRRIGSLFANALQGVGERVEELAIVDARVKLRAGIDAGNWRRKGDGVFSVLAESDRQVVLAIDELPILVDRLLKGGGERAVPEGKRAADAFLSWLRKNGQAHRGRDVMILSGSIGLEPILRRAGLSAQANIYSPFDLQPWDEATASACIGELAKTYGLDVSRMCAGICAAGCGVRCPTTCSSSSTIYMSICDASGEVQPRWKTWSASTLAKCSPSGDRWTWSTTRHG